MLTNRSIIVTGAGGGIGRAATKLFAEFGANVTAVDIAPEALIGTRDILHGGGLTCHTVAMDVRSHDSVRRMVDDVISRFGRVDGAFNNAGVEQPYVPLHELSVDHWRNVMSVDLDGVFFCMKFEIEAMLASGGGSIVNTASALAQVAMANGAGYVAAKHGVLGLTRAAAVEYAKQAIRVNAVLPGIIATPIVARMAADPSAAAVAQALRDRHPMGRFGEPIEIARAAAWLLSDASSFTTGTALAADGGYLAS